MQASEIACRGCPHDVDGRRRVSHITPYVLTVSFQTDVIEIYKTQAVVAATRLETDR